MPDPAADDAMLFADVRRLFEECFELPTAAREAHLAAAAPAVAQRVAELLSIATGEVRAADGPDWTDVLDATGAGLVLRDAQGAHVLKMFRIAPDRAAAFTAAADACRDAAARIGPTVVAPRSAGVAAENVVWFVQPFVGSTTVLVDRFASLARDERHSHAATLASVLERAAACGIRAPWPRPRQVLVDANGQLRVLDLGLSAGFALDPTTGEATAPEVAARRIVQAFARGNEDVDDVASVVRALRTAH